MSEEPRPPKILVVDDSATERKLLEGILQKDGNDVVAVGSGREALEVVEQMPPDVVLLDVVMPEMTGYQVCERLKQYEATCQIPVVFVTAKDDPNDLVFGLTLGGADFVSKPFNPPELIARVRSQVNIKRLQDRLAEANRELTRLSTTDALTGLMNRGTLNQRLAEELNRARRYRHWLSVILYDVDFFKRYNDTYGHLAGDEVLKQVAGVMQSRTRECDLAARFGGEEFTVVLPETDGPNALDLADRLRQAIWDAGLAHKSNSTADRVTVSGGVAAVVPGAHTRAEDLMAAADEALYRAKGDGRNRVVLAESPVGYRPAPAESA